MGLTRRCLIGAAAALPVASRAAARPTVTVGVLTDLSGPFREVSGQTSIDCVNLAVREFGDHGFDVRVISADHHDDPAQGAAIAKQWCDQGVDLVIDVPDSDVAMAVNTVIRARDRVYVNTAAGTTELTGGACSPNTVHWSYDTYMLAKSTGGAVVQAGGATWFIVGADYDFGRQLASETSRFVIQAGGRIEGQAMYPFPATRDFAPMLRQAQASGAQVLGLANAGTDFTECLTEARALGVADQMRLAGLLVEISDVHRLGLAQAGGLLLTESFYWDLNDRTRAFTSRLLAASPASLHPDMSQAGSYAGTLHFLKAVADLGAEKARAQGAAVVARMKAMPTDDDAFGAGSIRSDGRGMFPAFLFQVKTVEESAGAWDYYRLLSSTPPEQAFRPMGEGGCALVKA